MNLKNLTNDELMKRTQIAVTQEKEAVANVTRHFQEIYDRRLYLPKYASMFELLTREYGYCAGSAQLRINAIRLMKDVPDVREKLESGALSMTVASKIQTFLQNEKRVDRPYSLNAKVELIETCLGKSVSEAEREFVRRNPEVEKVETKRFISEDRLRISHTISSSLEAKLERIRLLWSHLDPNMSREILIERMADLTLEKIDPIRRAERAAKREASYGDVQGAFHSSEACGHQFKENSRYIKRNATHEVWRKNGERGCEFVNDQTGEICGSHFQLQRDHVIPFSAGGKNDAENLRILCGAHNRWRANF